MCLYFIYNIICANDTCVRYFGCGCCRESVAESWVGAEMSWVEVGGAGLGWVEVDGTGWRWVYSLAIPF